MSTWNREILENEGDYWCKELWDVAPKPLALSYQNLYNAVCEGNIGCTILLIRDTYELLIRIPVTVMFQGMYAVKEQAGETAFANALSKNDAAARLFLCSQTLLSEGDWKNCAGWAGKLLHSDQNFFKKNLENIEEAAVYELTGQHLRKLNHKMNRWQFLCSDGNCRDFVAWRNDTIGHGCLAQRSGLEYSEIPDILSKLADCATLSCEYYRKLSLVDVDGKSLKGADAVLAGNYGSEISLQFALELPDLKYIPMAHPFLSGRDKNIACYDGLRNRRSAYLLNYNSGRKYVQRELSEYLRIQSCAERQCLKDASIYAENLKSRDMQALEDKLYERETIIGMPFLYEWLMQAVRKQEKGVLLLTAEHGRGKSTFCRSINPLSEINRGAMNWNMVTGLDRDLRECWDDFAEETLIRVYHFRSDYNSRKDVFLQRLQEQFLMLEYQHENQFLGRLATIWAGLQLCGKEELSSRFTWTLEQTLSVYRNSIGKRRLLLVLDGIDEIDSWDDISPFLLDSNKLPEHIYILYTCRTQEECVDKPKAIGFLAKVGEEDRLEFSVEDSQAYVIRYIETIFKRLKRAPVEKEVRDLASYFNYRFSDLSAYGKLWELNSDIYPPQQRNMFDMFWSEVHSCTTEAYQNGLFELLTTLAWSGRPLTTRELAYLSGENRVSYQLLGMLYDLRAFLLVTRSESGNRYEFSHDMWQEAVKKQFPLGGIQFRMRCNELLKDLQTMREQGQTTDILKAEYEGERWLMANIFRIYYENLEEIQKDWFEPVQIRTTLEFLEELLPEIEPADSNKVIEQLELYKLVRSYDQIIVQLHEKAQISPQEDKDFMGICAVFFENAAKTADHYERQISCLDMAGRLWYKWPQLPGHPEHAIEDFKKIWTAMEVKKDPDIQRRAVCLDEIVEFYYKENQYYDIIEWSALLIQETQYIEKEPLDWTDSLAFYVKAPESKVCLKFFLCKGYERFVYGTVRSGRSLESEVDIPERLGRCLTLLAELNETGCLPEETRALQVWCEELFMEYYEAAGRPEEALEHFWNLDQIYEDERLSSDVEPNTKGWPPLPQAYRRGIRLNEQCGNVRLALAIAELLYEVEDKVDPDLLLLEKILNLCKKAYASDDLHKYQEIFDKALSREIYRSRCCTEVYALISHGIIDDLLIRRIPSQIMDFLKGHQDSSLEPDLDWERVKEDGWDCVLCDGAKDLLENILNMCQQTSDESEEASGITNRADNEGPLKEEILRFLREQLEACPNGMKLEPGEETLAANEVYMILREYIPRSVISGIPLESIIEIRDHCLPDYDYEQMSYTFKRTYRQSSELPLHTDTIPLLKNCLPQEFI